MFAIIRNNEIYKLIHEGTAFDLDGNQYPSNWINLSSPSEKAAIGMVDVVYAVRPDDKYYWVTENPPVCDSTKRFGTIEGLCNSTNQSNCMEHFIR